MRYIILGIETSCDETSIAVIEATASARKILFHIVASQEKLHRKYFGVVPELASRAHLTNISVLLQRLLQSYNGHSERQWRNNSGRDSSVVSLYQNVSKGRNLLDSIDTVAVTTGPGLAGSLLVGTTVAKTIAVMNNVPIVGINHLEGHIFSAFIDYSELKSSHCTQGLGKPHLCAQWRGSTSYTTVNTHPTTLTPPFIALIVSGGHTELVIVEDFGKYNVLGRTRDDAAGEAFDKVARLLTFFFTPPMRAGAGFRRKRKISKEKAGYFLFQEKKKVTKEKAVHEKESKQRKSDTVQSQFALYYPGGPAIEKLARLGNPEAIKFPRPYMWDSWDFSFSGLKTAVVYYIRDNYSLLTTHYSLIYDICASFQAAVVDTLVAKTLKAVEEFHLKKVVICGGVAANEMLRRRFIEEGKKRKLKVYIPLKEFCTDNAAMIATAGYYKKLKVRSEKLKVEGINAEPNLELQNWE